MLPTQSEKEPFFFSINLLFKKFNCFVSPVLFLIYSIVLAYETLAMCLQIFWI